MTLLRYKAGGVQTTRRKEIPELKSLVGMGLSLGGQFSEFPPLG